MYQIFVKCIISRKYNAEKPTAESGNAFQKHFHSCEDLKNILEQQVCLIYIFYFFLLNLHNREIKEE